MEMETLRNSVNYISILCSQYKFIKTVRKNVKFSNTQTSGPLNFLGDPLNLFFEVLRGPEKCHGTSHIFDPVLSLRQTHLFFHYLAHVSPNSFIPTNHTERLGL